MKKRVATLILAMLLAFVASLPAYSSPQPPRVSVNYTFSQDPSDTVTAVLTWDSSEGTTYHAYWADKMKSDGSDLDYININDSDIITVDNGKSKLLEMPGLEKYKNYFFKIVAVDGSGETSSFVRVYPVSLRAGRYNENAHGNYNNDTAACAWCHNTHSSLKEQLLVKSTYYDLCMLCHGTATSQSKYDVQSGKVTVANGTMPSLAGPFEEGVTSRHDANDSMPGWGAVSVPGSDPDKPLGLTCVSCHDGHAKTDDNYRMLKKTIYADDQKTIKSVSIDFKAYSIASSPTSGEELFMVKGNTEFCSACHLEYDNGDAKDPGSDPLLDTGATVSEYAYRHPSSTATKQYSVFGSKDYSPSSWGELPLQYNPDEHRVSSVVCSTCHYAHGTVKKFDTPEGKNKYILRLDNYGTCESCHKK